MMFIDKKHVFLKTKSDQSDIYAGSKENTSWISDQNAIQFWKKKDKAGNQLFDEMFILLKVLRLLQINFRKLITNPKHGLN